jgi:hypothetical protein
MRICWCGAPSLTTGRVCRSQFLLALDSAVILGSDSRPYFTVSDSRLSFSSPPTTRANTVEVFDPASTRDWSTTRFGFPVIQRRDGATEKTSFNLVSMETSSVCHPAMGCFQESNSTEKCVPSRCLPIGLCVTISSEVLLWRWSQDVHAKH